jgi:hypothetical protein
MDPCILDYSAEIPTKCSFLMAFIIPKFIEASTCFERFICAYGDRPLPRLSGISYLDSRYLIQCPLSLGNCRSPYGHINQRLQIQFGVSDDERCAAQNILNL